MNWFCSKKYEFVVSSVERKILHINGPFVPSAHDITIFRGGKTSESKDKWNKTALYFKVPDGKKVVADSAYQGEPSKVMTSNREYPKEVQTWLSDLLARGETLHKDLKAWNILYNRFRHNAKSSQAKMDLHQMVLEAVAVIVQYGYENGHGMFDL